MSPATYNPESDSVLASIAASVGVAAYTTGKFLVRSNSRRRPAPVFHWNFSGSFSSSADSACSSYGEERQDSIPDDLSVGIGGRSFTERLPSVQERTPSTSSDISLSRRASGASAKSDEGQVVSTAELEHAEGLPEDWSPWQLRPEHIEICMGPGGQPVSLGRGAFGEVSLAMMNGVIPVAVKSMQPDLKLAVREIALLKNLCNSHIVQFQGVCLKDDRLLLVQEFCEGGDLHKAIRKKAINWHKRGGQVALDVCRGLQFLHSNRVVHLDVKPANILLTRHCVAKIGDVGMARIKHVDGSRMGAFDHGENYSHVTSASAAPELLLGGCTPCTEKADMFSFGVVLHEICSGETAKRGCMRELKAPEECPQAVAELVDRLMAPDPEERPSAIQAHDVLHKALREQRGAAPSRNLVQSRSEGRRSLGARPNAGLPPRGRAHWPGAEQEGAARQAATGGLLPPRWPRLPANSFRTCTL